MYTASRNGDTVFISTFFSDTSTGYTEAKFTVMVLNGNHVQYTYMFVHLYSYILRVHDTTERSKTAGKITGILINID